MTEQDLFSLGKNLFGVAFPILTYVLGKATKGGANQTLLDQTCADLKLLQAEQIKMAAVLSSHTTLHDGYVVSNARFQGLLDENNRLLGKICGKLGLNE